MNKTYIRRTNNLNRMGDITEDDLFNIIPINPPVSTVDLTGQEIIDMLEENLEQTYSAEPMSRWTDM